MVVILKLKKEDNHLFFDYLLVMEPGHLNFYIFFLYLYTERNTKKSKLFPSNGHIIKKALYCPNENIFTIK